MSDFVSKDLTEASYPFTITKKYPLVSSRDLEIMLIRLLWRHGILKTMVEGRYHSTSIVIIGEITFTCKSLENDTYSVHMKYTEGKEDKTTTACFIVQLPKDEEEGFHALLRTFGGNGLSFIAQKLEKYIQAGDIVS